MSAMNRKMKSATFIKNFESVFKCPICNSAMHVVDLKSLVCEKMHTFDFAKQGYVNLMTKQLNTKYGKDLFDARRSLLSETDFFTPLIKGIIEIINREEKHQLNILDTGCGEGSHLDAICKQVGVGLGAGIDIAKEGILIAAKNYSDKIWAVADLANIPFKDHQYDIILNILSPANNKEFNRLLKDDGLVIKVVPGEGYLKELREAYFAEPKKQAYSNRETVERFTESFALVSRTSISYTTVLDHESIQSFVNMTPLTWSAEDARVAAFLKKQSAEITVDLEVLVGRKIV